MSFIDHSVSGPSSVDIWRTPTETSRKCVVTVRKESILSSISSSSSTVEFRGRDNWPATGSRQIAEDDRELNHSRLREQWSSGCSQCLFQSVQGAHDRTTVRYSARGGHLLRSPLALCSMQRHLSTVEVQQQSSTGALPASKVPPPQRRPSVTLLT